VTLRRASLALRACTIHSARASVTVAAALWGALTGTGTGAATAVVTNSATKSQVMEEVRIVTFPFAIDPSAAHFRDHATQVTVHGAHSGR
jgi:hypothetical protein